MASFEAFWLVKWTLWVTFWLMFHWWTVRGVSFVLSRAATSSICATMHHTKLSVLKAGTWTPVNYTQMTGGCGWIILLAIQVQHLNLWYLWSYCCLFFLWYLFLSILTLWLEFMTQVLNLRCFQIVLTWSRMWIMSFFSLYSTVG